LIKELDPLELLWQGIPFVYKLTSTLFATIKPEQMNGNVYNKLTVFQTEQKGKDIKRVASIPVQRLKVNGSLMISCLGYD